MHSLRRNRLRFLVREAAGGRDALEAFRMSFGMKDLEELSDRVAQQIAERHGLNEEALYDKLLWKHIVYLALSRVGRRRREEVKEALGIDSDEALGMRIVEDLMRDRGLDAEGAHELLLRVTLPQRCVEACKEILASTGASEEEFDELLTAAGIADHDELLRRVTNTLEGIDEIAGDRLAAALASAASPSRTELAMLLVALEVRARCKDSGARQASRRAADIRAHLQGLAPAC